MTVRLIRSAELAPAAPYAYAAVAGGTVFTAGTCLLDAGAAVSWCPASEVSCGKQCEDF